MSSALGHVQGAEQLRLIIESSIEIGIHTLTAFALSTENQSRTPKELNQLFSLFEHYLSRELDSMLQNGIALKIIGNKEGVPLHLCNFFREVEQKTAQGRKLQLVLAVNYGARDELVRAFQKIYSTMNATHPELKITEELISNSLDTAPYGDPDLVIRTSGESRLSNFLLWQSSYSEIFFSKELWPDFGSKHYLDAIYDYQKRDIRRGS